MDQTHTAPATAPVRLASGRPAREAWPLDPAVVHLNHGSFGAVPTEVLRHQDELRAADMIQTLSLTVGLLPLESILELYELRRVLEAHAVALSAARCDDATLSRLGDLLDRLEASEDVDEQSALDHDFHMGIVRLCGNESLGALVSVLRSRSRAYPVLTPETKRVSDAGHRAILRALTARDPVAASVAAAAHVTQSEVWLREVRPAPEAVSQAPEAVS